MKLNKKGFTLIELLAVIALLSVLATVSVVIVQSTMKKSNKKIDKIDKDKIKETAGAYIADNFESIKNSLNTKGCYIITGEELDSEGYMKLENNKKSLQLIVTKAGDKTFIEYPEEVSLNTSCYDLETNAVNGKYVLQNGLDDITISAGSLSGAYTGDNKNIVIPNSVTSISASVFDTKNLESVILPNNITSIGNHAFYGNQLKSVIIPNSVTSFGTQAFANNQLTMVTIPDSITSIGNYAFQSNQITSVTIPDSVTSIGTSVFYYNKLKNVTIPDSVTSIGNHAFYYNELTSIKLPDSLTTIGQHAFSLQSNKLTSVTIPSSVTSIGSYAFQYNPLKTIQNKTGRNFNWRTILNATSCTKTTGTSNDSFITGTCTYNYNVSPTGANFTGSGTVNITN